MAKKDSFSDDLNFVKEFEELKLKQKLLIDSLNRKNKTQMNEFLIDINSKLDFLVKIFKETMDNDSSEDEKNVLDEKLNSILENIDNKFNTLNEKIDNKFTDIEDQISLTKVSISNNVNPIKSIDNLNNSPLPPKPEFKAELSNKIPESFKKNEVKDKKKKWF